MSVGNWNLGRKRERKREKSWMNFFFSFRTRKNFSNPHLLHCRFCCCRSRQSLRSCRRHLSTSFLPRCPHCWGCCWNCRCWPCWSRQQSRCCYHFWCFRFGAKFRLSSVGWRSCRCCWCQPRSHFAGEVLDCDGDDLQRSVVWVEWTWGRPNCCRQTADCFCWRIHWSMAAAVTVAVMVCWWTSADLLVPDNT